MEAATFERGYVRTGTRRSLAGAPFFPKNPRGRGLSTPAPFLSRHLGDYLLVAQLSEDPLGTVFRALYAADDRRFVRLRVLQSEELAPESILLTIRENRLRDLALTHDAIVVRPELDLVEGIPFMVWDETAGWTLDTMLARVRAFGIRIPAEYALLIVERIAAALEHAHQANVGGRAVEHGLLWPGFVSISHDAVVRVGGFGVADGVLPSLGSRRMNAEIAPYIAPELRGEGKISRQGDVYSLGAILVELMTGRRPSLETPSAELRAGDPRSDELSAFLRRCLAEPAERFPSAIEAHRALQQMVTGNPFSLFTANLALFLYKLLNPESQSVAPSSDWESTSPVVLETKTRRGDATGTGTSRGEAPRRRRGDLDLLEETASDAAPTVLAPPVQPPPVVAPPVEAVPDFAPAPLEVQEHAAGLLEDSVAPPARTRTLGADPSRGNRAVLWLATAAGLAAGAFFVATHSGSGRTPEVAPAPSSATASSAPAPSPEPAPAAPTDAASPQAPAAGVVAASNRPAAVARPAKKIHLELKQPAEDLRYKAAIARMEADRQSAREKAPDEFAEGSQSQSEGEKYLHVRDYEAAQMAFSRAVQLFTEAREKSFEERVRGVSLSGGGQ
jgi:serine/threonine protein kinase